MNGIFTLEESDVNASRTPCVSWFMRWYIVVDFILICENSRRHRCLWYAHTKTKTMNEVNSKITKDRHNHDAMMMAMKIMVVNQQPIQSI